MRANAASALAELKASDAVPGLIRLLQDTDAKVCANAASALRKLKASEAVPGLIPLLQDAVADVRNEAKEALVQIVAYSMSEEAECEPDITLTLPGNQGPVKRHGAKNHPVEKTIILLILAKICMSWKSMAVSVTKLVEALEERGVTRSPNTVSNYMKDLKTVAKSDIFRNPGIGLPYEFCPGAKEKLREVSSACVYWSKPKLP